MAEENKTENNTENKRGFKAWLLAFFGAILGAIGTFFLCRRTSKDVSNIGGGFDKVGSQLGGAKETIDSARTTTSELGSSIEECERRANECSKIIERVRGQYQQGNEK